jgi:hypothetical protein
MDAALKQSQTTFGGPTSTANSIDPSGQVGVVFGGARARELCAPVGNCLRCGKISHSLRAPRSNIKFSSPIGILNFARVKFVEVKGFEPQ